MKNLWHAIAPFATDTTGACVVFERQSALVIAQDSNGSVSVLRRVMDVNRARAAYETVDLPEISYTLGRERDFQDRMKDLVEATTREAKLRGDEPPRFVVLVNGPVAALLGVDLHSRAQLLEESMGLPVLAVETTGNRYYDKGIEAAYDALYERFVAPGPRCSNGPADSRSAGETRRDGAPGWDPARVNFLGLTELDWPGREYLRAAARWLREKDRSVIADFGFGDDPEAWRRASRADGNVVFSMAGLRLARRMEADFGVPYRCVCELDWFDDMAAGLHLAGAPRALVIGEQVSAGVVRRLLQKAGASVADVATFYTSDGELEQEGGFRLKGEADLCRALSAESGYDFAVCDRSLARVAEIPVFPLMHPPTGFGARDDTELSRVWLESLAHRVNTVWR